MAFPATLRRLIIALNGYDGPEYYQAGQATLKPGMIVAEDDADEVKLCEETLYPIGIVGCDADHDFDTAYDAGERVPVYPLGCGVDIYVLCKDPTTIDVNKGVIIESSDTAAHDGHGKVIDLPESTTVVTVRNTSSIFWIGRALETADITSAVAKYVPVKLSL